VAISPDGVSAAGARLRKGEARWHQFLQKLNRRPKARASGSAREATVVRSTMSSIFRRVVATEAEPSMRGADPPPGHSGGLCLYFG